eukprot:CFRG7297T1
MSSNMMAGDVPTLLQKKANGNDCFKNKEYTKAIKSYTSALDESPDKDFELILRRNIAACYINLNQPEDALLQCKLALSLNGRDVKALYREAQAYEQLGRTNEAVQTLRKLMAIDNTNREAKNAMARIMSAAVSESQDSVTIKALIKKLQAATKGKDQIPILERINSMTKSEAITLDLLTFGYVDWLLWLMSSSPSDNDVIDSSLRSLVSMATHIPTALGIVTHPQGPFLQQASSPKANIWVSLYMQSSTNVSRSTTRLLLCLFNTLNEARQADPDRYSAAKNHAMAIVSILNQECNNTFISASEKRRSKTTSDGELDANTAALVSQLETLSTCMTPSLAQALIENSNRGGVTMSGTLISVIGEYRSAHVRLVVSAVISRVFACLNEESQTLLKTALLDTVVRGLDGGNDIHTQGHALAVVNAVFVANLRLGIWLVDADGVLGKVLDCYDRIEVLCETKNESVEKTHLLCGVAECLSHCASNKTKCLQLLKNGVTQLHEMYMSDDMDVSVRALVGLSRVMSAASLLGEAKELTSEMSVGRLYDAAASVVKAGASKSVERGLDMSVGERRRWAIECLAVQSINADVKDMIVNDETMLKVLFGEMQNSKDLGVAVGLVSMVQNITCSTRKKHLTDEQKELQSLSEFAKESIEREQAKDSPDRVQARVLTMVKAGLLPALVQIASMSETSLSITESIARVLVTVATEKSARGAMVAAGAHNTLLRCYRLLGVGMQKESSNTLSQARTIDTEDSPSVSDMTSSSSAVLAEGYAEARDEAAQGLARIAITQDPNTTFPGQKCYELIRPLVGLLGSLSELKVFESLLALTNLASMGDEVRNVIINEQGVEEMSKLQLDENENIQRAATECLCNMIASDEVFELYCFKEGKRFNDIKLWTLLCGSDDQACVTAASGGLAQLSRSPDVCDALYELERGYSFIQELLVSPVGDIAFRGLYILQNILKHKNKEHAKKFVDMPNSIEILSALVAKPNQQQNVVQIAKMCLNNLETMKAISKA